MAIHKLGDKGLGTSLPTIPTWCLLLMLLLWLAGYYSYGHLENWLINSPHQSRIQDELDTETHHYRQQFDRQIAQIVDKVSKLSNDPETLRVALDPAREASDWQRRARTLESLSPKNEWMYTAKIRLPNADRIFLLNNRSPPLPGNFVADLLIDEAFQGKSPPPRAAKTDQWNVYIARPVFQDHKVAGVVLVEYKPSIFSSAIRMNSDKPGRVELIQSVQNFRDVVIFAEGNGWKEEYSATLPTQLENWKIRFTGDKAFIDSTRSNPLQLRLVTTLMVLTLIALCFLLIKKTIVFPQATKTRPKRLNPLDDLFTEKYSRFTASPTTSAKREPSSDVSPNLPPQPMPAPTAQEPTQAIPQKNPSERDGVPLPDHIFRDYDIRGVAHKEISREFAGLLGKALGTLMLQQGSDTLAVCADGRVSSPGLKNALKAGILSTGCDVIDIGSAPTPVLNFALFTLENCRSGVMVTASHNPKDDNGFKIIIDNKALSSEQIRFLREEMAEGNFTHAEGEETRLNLISSYIHHIVEDVVPPPELEIAIDCGNAIATVVAPTLFSALGCEVTELFGELDGNFPNHNPDPTVSENLQSLRKTVINHNLDLGLAFDGDGDRVVAITSSGRIVWPDELLMIFARDIVSRNPGQEIIFDVKSTRRLNDVITGYGGIPVMWKTGHAHIRNKVNHSSAPLGGEYSGHIFFNDRWFGFDDGLYAAARLLEIISIREQTLDEIIDSFPSTIATEEIRIPIDESKKRGFIERFMAKSNFGEAHLITLDGLRVEFDNGWGLIRVSNTSAALTLRFEADTDAALAEIMADFRSKLAMIDPAMAAYLNESNL